MFEYKSIQELIVKAAIYDGVSTTISPFEVIGGADALKIIFSRDDRYVSVSYMLREFNDYEAMVLSGCKNALCSLLFAPYKEISCEEKK